MDLLKTDALLVLTTVLTTVEQRRTLGPSVSVVIGLLFGLTTFGTAEALISRFSRIRLTRFALQHSVILDIYKT